MYVRIHIYAYIHTKRCTYLTRGTAQEMIKKQKRNIRDLQLDLDMLKKETTTIILTYDTIMLTHTY